MISSYLSTAAFFGFAVYSIFFIFFKHFKFAVKEEQLGKIDQSARIVVGLAGLLFALIWTSELIIILWSNDISNRNSLIDRMFGKYALGFWLQPLCSIIFSQLVWFKEIANNSFIRLVIAWFLFVDFEKLTIILTSLHRDYLPSSWTMYSDFSLFGCLISGWILKLMFFTFMVTLTYLIKNRKKI
jgi:hypothetical protein